MNKSMLYSGLLSILTTTAFADNVTLAANTSNPVPVTTIAVNNTATPQPTTDTTPEVTAPATADPKAAVVTPTVPPVINCNYAIPPATTHVEKSIVLQWAEKATQQSFDFDSANVTQQLAALKLCYTESGWQSFNDALQKSGNIQAIQTQNLMVSSMVDGQTTITETKENQWKISVPLQVVYQNDKEKLTQLLTVDLLVSRKITGDLGIMQMIASPRQTVNANPDATTTVSTTPSVPAP